MRIERKVGVAGDGEVVDSEGVQRLCRLKLAGHRLCRTELGEAVGDEEDEDNEEAIGGALDLEVAEEGVGTKEVEGFVNDIRLRWIRCRI